MSESMSARSTVALAVSPRLLLDGLRRGLEAADFETGFTTSTSEDAVPAILSLCPALVVVSVRLPPLGGLHVISSISQSRTDLRIVAVAESGRSDDGERALRAGALGWLDTDSEWSACLEVLQSARRGDARLPRRHRRTPLPGVEEILTRRERQVLDLVLASYSIPDMARELVISPKTIKHHLSAVYAKLGVRTRTEAALAAVRQGLPVRDQASG